MIFFLQLARRNVYWWPTKTRSITL